MRIAKLIALIALLLAPAVTAGNTHAAPAGTGDVPDGIYSAAAAPHPLAGAMAIPWEVISSGGGSGSSTNFGLTGTAGQIAVGTGTSPNFGLSHGFWQMSGAGGVVTLPLHHGDRHAWDLELLI